MVLHYYVFDEGDVSFWLRSSFCQNMFSDWENLKHLIHILKIDSMFKQL